MPRGWGGNRMTVVALALKLKWFVYPFTGSKHEDKITTPDTLI